MARVKKCATTHRYMARLSPAKRENLFGKKSTPIKIKVPLENTKYKQDLETIKSSVEHALLYIMTAQKKMKEIMEKYE